MLLMFSIIMFSKIAYFPYNASSRIVYIINNTIIILCEIMERVSLKILIDQTNISPIPFQLLLLFLIPISVNDHYPIWIRLPCIN